MKLDEQQQNKVMIGAGVLFGLFIIYYIFSLLYLSPRTDLLKKIKAQQTLFSDNATLHEKAAVDDKKWKELNILSDGELMEADLRQTVINASSGSAGAFDLSKWTIGSYRPLTVARTAARPDTRTDFGELHFTASAFTSTAHIGRFLAYLESIKMPAKIDKVKISARKSGNDDLSVDVYLSALVYAPRNGGNIPLPQATTADDGSSPDDLGFAPGPGGVIKPLDPPLPEGTDIAEQMRKRRQLQLAAPETPATPAASTKTAK